MPFALCVFVRLVLLAAAMHARLALAGGMLVAETMRARFMLGRVVHIAAAIVTGLVLTAAVVFAATINTEHSRTSFNRITGLLDFWIVDQWIEGVIMKTTLLHPSKAPSIQKSNTPSF